MEFRRADTGSGHGEFSQLERQLRAERTEPSASLQQAVAQLTSARPRRRAPKRMRLALAGGLTAALLATAALLGAASGKSASSGSNASASEYGELVVICHQARANTPAHTLRLSPRAAKQLLAHFPLDKMGPCP